MIDRTTLVLTVALLGVGVLAEARPRPVSADIPPAARLELRHLEETYRVLDKVAARVWPGWDNYRDYPFLLDFQNGLRLLINHPNPPAGFELVPDVTVGGLKVHADRRNLTGLRLVAPLSAGGGLVPFGVRPDGQMVTIVHMTFQPTDGAAKHVTERQILINIHELFHCFQEKHVLRARAGNLQFNPDANFAAYSAIEGQALARAFAQADAEQARAFLRDFLVARQLKRAGSMTAQQALEESSDDVSEGTAVYSEVKTLESLKDGYTPGLTSTEDPAYGGFVTVDELLAGYVSQLEGDAKQPLDAKMKVYHYGCFQALMLQRLAPGWQAPFSSQPSLLDETLKRVVPVTAADAAGAGERFEKEYRLSDIRSTVEKAIGARDEAYRQIAGRRGRTYVVDFKAIGFVSFMPAREGAMHQLGLLTLLPAGVAEMQTNAVKLSAVTAPALMDQIYYLKVVDDHPAPGAGYTLTCGARDGDICRQAVVKTPLFTLEAPKLEVKVRGDRVKFRVLARE